MSRLFITPFPYLRLVFYFLFFVLILNFGVGLVAEPSHTSEPKSLAPETKAFVSPMRADGLDVEFMRSMLLPPEQVTKVSQNQNLWFDNYRVGFYIRPRIEARNNFDFNKNTNDRILVSPQNTQVWFVGDPSPYISFKLTIQDARLWGGSYPASGGDNRRYSVASAGKVIDPASPTPTVVQNTTDIREGFLILKLPDTPLKAQVGRQIPLYADQRLLGAANFPANGVSMDGVRLLWNEKKYFIHLLGFQLTEESDAAIGLLTKNGRKNGSIDDSYLYGFYSSYTPEIVSIDIYTVALEKKYILNPNPATIQDRERQRDILITSGFRLTNRTANNNLPKGQVWDWTWESMWQYGPTGERVDRLNSPLVNGEAVWKDKVLYDTSFHYIQSGILFFDRLRVGVQYSFASGDPNRTDSRSSTYQPMFMPRHATFPIWNNINGISEFSSWRNVITRSVNIAYTTESWGKWIFAVWDYRKAKSQDGWYVGNGALAENASTESIDNDFQDRGFLGYRLGISYDLSWIYYFGDYYSIWAGASVIKAHDAIRNQRDNVRAVNPEERYTFDGTSTYSFIMVVAGF
jgi:hypothetical protein